MAGITIHLAIAKEYLRKNPNKIKNEKQFYKGALAPDFNKNTNDLVKDKNETHYGVWGNGNIDIDIKKFLQDSKVKIEEDFWKGYFFHLLSDYYFYHIFFIKEYIKVRENKDTLYHDYDCLNKVILEKYEIIPEEYLKKWMNMINEKTKYLQEDKVIQFIDKISSINIEEQIKIISQKGMEGILNEYRN